MPIMGILIIRRKSEMEYVVIRNNRALVTINGVFRASISVVLKAELEQAFRQGCQKVVFDFQNTTFIDSPSLKVILKTLDSVGAENMDIINVRRNDKIHNSFKRYRIENYISSFV